MGRPFRLELLEVGERESPAGLVEELHDGVGGPAL